jgi:hypothetical protein
MNLKPKYMAKYHYYVEIIPAQLGTNRKKHFLTIYTEDYKNKLINMLKTNKKLILTAPTNFNSSVTDSNIIKYSVSPLVNLDDLINQIVTITGGNKLYGCISYQGKIIPLNIYKTLQMGTISNLLKSTAKVNKRKPPDDKPIKKSLPGNETVDTEIK